MQRFIQFLYSRKNIAGTVLALAGLGLFFAGVIKAFWLPIVIGLYAIGAIVTPAPRVTELSSLSEEQSDAEIAAAMDKLVDEVKQRAGAEISAKVESIRDSIADVLPKTSGQGGLDDNVFVIRQTVFDYLPRALNSYLSLPRTYARVHPVTDGKTSHQILVEQLTLLDEEMKKIADAVNAADAQQLVVHGKFLKEQFGKNAPQLLEMAARK